MDVGLICFGVAGVLMVLAAIGLNRLDSKIEKTDGNVSFDIPEPRLSPCGTFYICDECGEQWKFGNKPNCKPCEDKWAEIDKAQPTRKINCHDLKRWR